MAAEPMTDIADTLPQDWKYVSEGGATIVFSYTGPPNPRFDETVLRLRKSTVPALAAPTLPSHASDLDGSTWVPDAGLVTPEDEPDDPMIEYQQKCMERLIPREHLPRLESVRVDGPWLEALAALHELARPVDRREKDQIDVLRRKGVLATDLVGGEGLAVEIKVYPPKLMFPPHQLTRLHHESRNGHSCHPQPISQPQLVQSRPKPVGSACTPI